MEPRTALLALLLSAALLSPAPTWAAPDLPAPMLATRFHDIGDVGAWSARSWTGCVPAGTRHQLLDRNGDRIDAPGWFTAGWPAQAIEGELRIARGRFQQVSDLARALRPDESGWRQVRFMAFDLPGDAGPFAQRAQRLRSLVGQVNAPRLQAIAQARVAGRAALDARLRTVMAAGGEGLMLQCADARCVADAATAYEIQARRRMPRRGSSAVASGQIRRAGRRAAGGRRTWAPLRWAAACPTPSAGSRRVPAPWSPIATTA